MAEYWLVRTTGDAVEGPFTAPQLREMAQAGSITRDSMIHGAGEWHAAATVKGLFDEPPPVPGPPQESDTYQVEDVPQPVSAPTPAPIGFAAPHDAIAPPPAYEGGYHAGTPGRARNLNWLLVLASLLLAFGLVTIIVSVVEDSGDFENFDSFEEWLADDTVHASDIMGCFQILGWLGLWVYWLVWVYTVHSEVQEYLGEKLPIGPGLALGLCFVPVFNLFWGIYMPYRLGGIVSERTGGAQSRIVPGIMLTFLILGVAPGCCLWPGLAMLFRALAMRHLQNGLNEMWTRGAAAGFPGAAY